MAFDLRAALLKKAEVETARLVDEGIIRPTATQILHGINAANLRRAHEMLERGDMVGKLVVEGWDN